MLTRNDYKIRLDWQDVRFYRDLIAREAVARKPGTLPPGAGPALELLTAKVEDQWKFYAKFGEGFWQKDLPVIVTAIGYATVAMELIEDHHWALAKFYGTAAPQFDLDPAERYFAVVALQLFTSLEAMVKNLKSATFPNGENVGPQFLNEIYRERLAIAHHLCTLAIGLAGNDPRCAEETFAKKWRGQRTDVRKRLATAWSDAAKFDQHDDRRERKGSEQE